jgi:23S rRNA pseudouridine2605 synthase
MRINRFVAQATGMSRRNADKAISEGRVQIDGQNPVTGMDVGPDDHITLDGHRITGTMATMTLILNKPAGYVCSRNGQGSKTVYDLLPSELHHLKTVGRLDKDSSGLLLLTSDGDLAHQLTHPSYEKPKIYEVTLDADLQPPHHQTIQEHGIQVDDYISKFSVERLHDDNDKVWRITLKQGKNRQIRKTFAVLGYKVTKLHRTYFGLYSLNDLQLGKFIVL